MNTVKNVTIAILLAFAPLSLAFATECIRQKSFLLGEIDSAIGTYPSSCRSAGMHIRCDVLFRTKLPQLGEIIQRDDFRNFRRVVAGVNGAAGTLREIVADAYLGQMNSLIGDLNAYDSQCAR